MLSDMQYKEIFTYTDILLLYQNKYKGSKWDNSTQIRL